MCATEQYPAGALTGARRYRLPTKIAGAAAVAVLLMILMIVVIVVYVFPLARGGFATGHGATPQQAALAEPAGPAITCGRITLPRAFGARDAVANGHLPARSFPFLIGLKNAHARGQLTVTPGIVCQEGRVGFNLFGGVSREKDYFDLKMIEGQLPSQWSYLEQWLIEEKVTFDDGTTLVVNDQLLGAQVPAGAKRVVRIELRMWSGRDAEGHDSEALLTWE